MDPGLSDILRFAAIKYMPGYQSKTDPGYRFHIHVAVNSGQIEEQYNYLRANSISGL